MIVHIPLILAHGAMVHGGQEIRRVPPALQQIADFSIVFPHDRFRVLGRSVHERAAHGAQDHVVALLRQPVQVGMLLGDLRLPTGFLPLVFLPHRFKPGFRLGPYCLIHAVSSLPRSNRRTRPTIPLPYTAAGRTAGRIRFFLWAFYLVSPGPGPGKAR